MNGNKNQIIAARLQHAVSDWEERSGEQDVLELFGQLRVGLAACCRGYVNPRLHSSLPNTDCDSPQYQSALTLQVELMDFLASIDDK